MRIRFWTGAEWDGVLLGSKGRKMRIAVPGCDDAVELRSRGGQWFAENGDPVQIDLIPADRQDPPERWLGGEGDSIGAQAQLWVN